MPAKKSHPPGTPAPKPDLSDMDAVHRNAQSEAIADRLFNLGKIAPIRKKTK